MHFKKLFFNFCSRVRISNLILIIACLSLAVLGGCSLTRHASIGEPDKEGLGICTSFYPIYIMALNITQDVPGVRLTNIAPTDIGCLHGVQLSPAELMLLEQSDIFIINGSGMEEYLSKVTENLPDLEIIDSTSNLNVTNPHTWVSISFNIEQARYIGEQLSRFDPQNKELYLRNTENYTARLLALKDKMHQELKAVQNRGIITFHQAFLYFAREFNLDILAVVQREAGSEPSARELAEIIKLIEDNQVKAIFIEPQYPDATAQAIARETEAKVYTLDPAATGPLVADGYILAMERNLLTLLEALKE